MDSLNKQIKKLMFELYFAEAFFKRDWKIILMNSKPIIIETIDTYLPKYKIPRSSQKEVTKLTIRALFNFLKVPAEPGLYENPFVTVSLFTQMVVKRIIKNNFKVKVY